MTQFDARNVSMVMDLYELTMAEGYFKSGDQPRVTFFTARCQTAAVLRYLRDLSRSLSM